MNVFIRRINMICKNCGSNELEGREKTCMDCGTINSPPIKEKKETEIPKAKEKSENESVNKK